MIATQLAWPATRERTYAWLMENFDEAVMQVPESFRAQAVPGLGSYHCSEAKADEWESFVTANGDLMPGYERSLAQATESIRLCAALRGAKADELVAALTKR